VVDSSSTGPSCRASEQLEPGRDIDFEVTEVLGKVLLQFGFMREAGTVVGVRRVVFSRNSGSISVLGNSIA
jgi:hypothetical protein